MKYAQINNDGVCFAESFLHSVVDHAKLIPIPSDFDALGKTFDGTSWHNPVPVESTPDPTAWLVDVGPFFDRFGAAKMAVLSHPDAVVQALVKDLQVRKWIDLQRADVAQGIDLLIAKGVPGLNAALKQSILTTEVRHDENLALRKMYFA